MKKELEEIVATIAQYKGLTKKNTERLVIDLIENPYKLANLQNQLIAIQNQFAICQICYGLLTNQRCIVCDDPSRDKEIICVVSSLMDLFNLEKFDKYYGQYAVLGGEINLKKGITPDKLAIEPLLKRIKPGMELILALNATFEGEVTANYIARLLSDRQIKITRIAKGIPMGGMVDYMDETTLENALNNRKNMEDD